MTTLLLMALALQGPAADNRLLVVEGSDTTVHAVTDTLELAVGESLEVLPEIHANGSVLPRSDLWVHNVSHEFLEFAPPIENGRFSANPIHVTGLQRGIAPVMVHWSVQSGGAIWVVFRVAAAAQKGKGTD